MSANRAVVLASAVATWANFVRSPTWKNLLLAFLALGFIR